MIQSASFPDTFTSPSTEDRKHLIYENHLFTNVISLRLTIRSSQKLNIFYSKVFGKIDLTDPHDSPSQMGSRSTAKRAEGDRDRGGHRGHDRRDTRTPFGPGDPACRGETAWRTCMCERWERPGLNMVYIEPG
jgi:hypothetical protein